MPFFFALLALQNSAAACFWNNVFCCIKSSDFVFIGNSRRLITHAQDIVTICVIQRQKIVSAVLHIHARVKDPITDYSISILVYVHDISVTIL